MKTHDKTVAEMAAVRDAVLAALFEHERDRHGGEPCWGQRVSVVAYLAHSLGLTPGTVFDTPDGPLTGLEAVGLELEAYHRECLARGCCGLAGKAPGGPVALSGRFGERKPPPDGPDAA